MPLLPRAALALLVLAAAPGCSNFDPAALGRKDELRALDRQPRIPPPHRIIIAPVEVPHFTALTERATHSAMRLDAPALHEELVQALGRVLAEAAPGDPPPVIIAASSEGAMREAWADGRYDLCLRVRVQQWDATFLGNTGWWWPNALFFSWYFYPLGPQWLIADELYGVELVLDIDVLGVASEAPLPELSGRRLTVRSLAPDDKVAPNDPLERDLERDLVAVGGTAWPRLALSDLQRGLDLKHIGGTYDPGDLDAEQWERVSTLLEPAARRHAAVRIAAAVSQEVREFERLSDEAKARALAATHAVVVGESGYDGVDVPGAMRDAEAMAGLLVEPRGVAAVSSDGTAGVRSSDALGGRSSARERWAPEKNVTLLRNPAPEAVLAALDRVAKRAAPQDEVVIAFAGRGSRIAGAGLAGLALDLQGGKLPLDVLAAWLGKIKASRRTVILDCGLGGAGPDEVRAAPDGELPPLDRDELERALRGLLAGASRGGVIVASGPGKDDVAQVWEEHGLLTGELVRGLRGEADVDQDGLSWNDLAAYLERQVVNLSEVALPHPQRPIVISVAGDDRVGP